MMKLILSLTLIWTLSSTGNENQDVMKSTRKLCLPSSHFNEGNHTFSLNLGFDAITASVHVCNTDGCNNKTIPYPGVQKKNGMKCFACYEPFSALCNIVQVQCMGVQDRCIKGIAENERNKNATFYTLGCVSANLCEDVRRFEFFMEVQFYGKPKCCGKNLCNSAWSVRLNVMSLLLGLFTLTFY